MALIGITGANGHLGNQIVRAALCRGHSVRATVRDLNDRTKLAPLEDLLASGNHRGRLELVDLELLSTSQPLIFAEGLDAIVHSASPNIAFSENPVQQIVDPIRKGTQALVRAGIEAQVKTFVFTSSASAAGLRTDLAHPITEESWNLSPKSALLSAKIAAEQDAAALCQSSEMRWVALLPPSLLGPGFFRHTPTTEMYELVAVGIYPSLPNIAFHIADVRDVAMAHIIAVENKQAHGRFLVAGEFVNNHTFPTILKSIEPKLRIFIQTCPDWLLTGAYQADRLANRLFGRPRHIDGAVIEDLKGTFQWIDCSRAQRVLQWNPRPLTETLQDTLRWIRDRKPTKAS